nr:DUF5830 family protein [Halorutilus salinus]
MFKSLSGEVPLPEVVGFIESKISSQKKDYLTRIYIDALNESDFAERRQKDNDITYFFSPRQDFELIKDKDGSRNCQKCGVYLETGYLVKYSSDDYDGPFCSDCIRFFP